MTPSEFTQETLKSQAANLGELLKERFTTLVWKYPEISPAAMTDIINTAIDVYAAGVKDGTDHANDILNLIMGGKRG